MNKNISKSGHSKIFNHDGVRDLLHEAWAAQMQDDYDEHVIRNMNVYEHNYHQFYKSHEPRIKSGGENNSWDLN